MQDDNQVAFMPGIKKYNTDDFEYTNSEIRLRLACNLQIIISDFLIFAAE